MFEITGDDVGRLGDADLRTLVARLSLAELAAQGLPRSAVTAGGHQDARDGGIDVRVEFAGAMPAADFVPRTVTGFQVKRPDMPASEIIKEMRPEPGQDLRPAIVRLVEQQGAYIIVSAQGSVADQPLKDRREAMREALADTPNSEGLHTDFYDRERLATWTNQYPGAAAWVRARTGALLSGWRTIGTWSGAEIAEGHGYLVSEDAKVISERTGSREPLSIPQALDELRSKLQQPRQCIRLIGMSGVGKTRFVEALFETGAGEAAPLDPALSIYTDFAEDIAPSAREMARRLVDTGQRAILIVDNCNPATHAELATICSTSGQVSLLTVEYDVREDEPERTEVFRLTSGSGNAIEAWIRREFPHVTQVDRHSIAAFSDGNFRVARALAETVGRGETLGRLRSHELFERLFVQRNAPDQQLLRDAEVLALVYSFDGEDEAANGELALLGTIAGRSVRDLFGATAELRTRGIIQARGRWRAVLPQAIANRLAASALTRIPPGALDTFCRTASARLLKSLSRRLGYLHDSAEARAVVDRWLRPDGPLKNVFDLGDIGLDVIANVAPTSPDTVLKAVEAELGSGDARMIATTNRQRSRWIRLLKALAYPSDSFEKASILLARFVAAEPDGHNTDAAREPFAELFHIHLSGTRASRDQRLQVTRGLLQSGERDQIRVGLVALDALLKTSHFSSSHTFDFGARPRDFGWQPTVPGDIDSWFGGAIDLAIEVSSTIPEAKVRLGSHVRGLWRFRGCHARIETAADHFLASGAWLDGWIGLRAALRWDGDGMADADRERLSALIERVRPTLLLERARAVVLTRTALGFDVTDGDEGDPVQAYHRASDVAVDLGKAMAGDDEALRVFLTEVLNQQAPRAFEFGRGLALGTSDVEATWHALTAAFAAVPPETRNVTVIGGFLSELHKVDPKAANVFLEAVFQDEALRRALPYLQARAKLDAEGLGRLQRLAESGTVEADYFAELACGVVEDAESSGLIALLEALAGLARGIGIALDILFMRLSCAKDKGPDLPSELVAYGRALLTRAEFGHARPLRDYGLGELVEYCLADPDAAPDARILCQRFLAAIKAYEIYAHDAHYLITALFRTQPVVALDCLVDSGEPQVDDDLFDSRLARASPIEVVEVERLIEWADLAPERRYPRLGVAMPVFALQDLDHVTGLSEHFLAVLRQAPDKAAFLGSPFMRVYPSGWAGSLVANLEHRKAVLAGLADVGDAAVDAWLIATNRAIDDWVARERDRESAQEETFE